MKPRLQYMMFSMVAVALLSLVSVVGIASLALKGPQQRTPTAVAVPDLPSVPNNHFGNLGGEAVVAEGLHASDMVQVAMTRDPRVPGAYEGMLVRGGKMYELRLEGSMLHIEEVRSTNTWSIALHETSMGLEGEWIVSGHTVEITFNKYEKVLTFSFPYMR